MKKATHFILGILITSIVFYSCSLLNSLEEVNKNGFVCSNYNGQPLNKMNTQDVVNMVRNYYNKQYAAINNTIGNARAVPFPSTIPVDSRAVFFNLDTLKRLIYYIEKSSESFSATEKQNLGVNVYFASYPGENKYGQRQIKHGFDYMNRHTLIFIPSIFDNIANTAKDFDLETTFNNKRLTYINSKEFFNIQNGTIGGMTAMMQSPAASSSTGMVSQNNGTGTPPPRQINGDTDNPLLDATDPQ